ncbi:hypothetical protein U0C82_03940 [Fulvimarina sp. 2208YS6-2-32]|uniref:Uncharacterized protein n=1 Tax=Fulvimarina uroteuthidis TaxID=3098149 RepID=A0ABU5HYU5_9HYPH|nr:hypothetical protein [Fulvimarina sp. 2208YS6-2-32]MDY8108301.1 hypothetical protein [Fulvimarina sp. 2208YS6-2-32]
MTGTHTNAASSIASLSMLLVKRARELASMCPTPSPDQDEDLLRLHCEIGQRLGVHHDAREASIHSLDDMLKVRTVR